MTSSPHHSCGKDSYIPPPAAAACQGGEITLGLSDSVALDADIFTPNAAIVTMVLEHNQSFRSVVVPMDLSEHAASRPAAAWNNFRWLPVNRFVLF